MSAVELAVIAPALIGLIFLVIQAGLYLYARNVVDSAARYGVRTARVYDPAHSNEQLAENGKAAASDYAHQIAGKAVDITAVDATRDDQRVTVTVTGKAIALIPGFPVTVTARHHGPTERFIGNQP